MVATDFDGKKSNSSIESKTLPQPYSSGGPPSPSSWTVSAFVGLNPGAVALFSSTTRSYDFWDFWAGLFFFFFWSYVVLQRVAYRYDRCVYQ